MADVVLELGEIDRSADVPPYQQIAAVLRGLIESGQLGPGDQLPSETDLLEHFGVARMTTRQALQELRGEGLTVAKHGRGVFVRPAPPIRRLASDRFARRHREQGQSAFTVEAVNAGRTAQVDSIAVFRASPTPDIAKHLRLSPESVVVVRSRRYLVDGQPVETAVSYVPVKMADGTAIEEPDSGPGGIYARLEERGHVLTRFVEEVGARMPTPKERKALNLSPGVPVLTVLRTAFDADDVAVEVCDTVKAAHAFLLEYEFPAR